MAGIRELLIQKIEEVYGKKIEYCGECESLAAMIEEITGCTLALVTLKRFFGFTKAKVEPRLSTLDILSRFCGYADFEMARGDLLNSSLISEFKEMERIVTKDLKINDIVGITYDPDREIEFLYLGDSKFRVIKSIKSKLIKGDIVTIDSFNLGFELIADDIERDGISLGNYIGAKQTGISFLSLLSS